MSEHKHWRSLFARDEKFLGSWNLEKDGKYEQVVVHIEKFYQDTLIGSMGKESKVVCKLKEFDKSMVVNRTNFKRLQQKFGSFDMNDYLSKPVILNVEKVKSPEGMVDALRFSTRPAEVKKSLPALKDEDVSKVKEKIANGELTLEKLKTMRTLTKEQEDEIKSK